MGNLPAHQFIRVSVDVCFVTGRNGGFPGLRVFWLTALHGPKLIHATFGSPGSSQSFPELEPWSGFPGGTGAAQSNALGYGNDQVYHLSGCFPHAGKSLTLNFAGDDLQYAGAVRLGPSGREGRGARPPAQRPPRRGRPR